MNYTTLIRENLSELARKAVPRIYWNRKITHYRQRFSEVEMNLLPLLCKEDKTSIDVGAAGGVYIANMANKSKHVIGFEPIPDDAEVIMEMIAATKLNATVENVALSNQTGEAVLKMLQNDTGRSTIEASNELSDSTGSERKEIIVPIKKMDDYRFEDIGFVKIDVEGHEGSVLEGAINTVINNNPNLLIEIEERHKKNSIAEVVQFLDQLDYSGYYILNNEIIPVEFFEPERYQDEKNIGDHTDHYVRKGIYINNFIFIPRIEKDAFIEKATKCCWFNVRSNHPETHLENS